jgi:hypothetical protein
MDSALANDVSRTEYVTTGIASVLRRCRIENHYPDAPQERANG